MQIDLEKLYEPYSKDASLDSVLGWLKKEARILAIDDDVVQATIVEVFTEMAHGKTFPKHPYHTKSYASFSIYLKDRMIQLNKKACAAFADIVRDRVNTAIIGYMKEDNERYVASKMQYKPWKETILSKYFRVLRYYRDNSVVVKKVSRWL